VSAVEFVTNGDQLSALEFGHAQAAPAFSRSDQSGVHQLEHGALAECVGDDLGASPLLAEWPLEQMWCGSPADAYAPSDGRLAEVSSCVKS